MFASPGTWRTMVSVGAFMPRLKRYAYHSILTAVTVVIVMGLCAHRWAWVAGQPTPTVDAAITHYGEDTVKKPRIFLGLARV